jgi:hypothetical protein
VAVDETRPTDSGTFIITVAITIVLIINLTLIFIAVVNVLTVFFVVVILGEIKRCDNTSSGRELSLLVVTATDIICGTNG